MDDEAIKAALTALDGSTRRYRRTEAAHKASRDASVADVVAALRLGARPTDVVEHAPFTAAHVRSIARENGIEPAKKGKKEASE